MSNKKRLGVHGLVTNSDGKYLVMKRSELDEDEGNCWDPVGGGIEAGETIEEGFKREVVEEAGLKVTNVKVVLAYTLDEKGLQLIVTAQTDSSNVVLSTEHNDYKWVTYEEMLNIKPVSLHFKAVQHMLNNDVEVARYEDYK